MKKKNIIYAGCLAFTIAISGCKKDDPETPVTPVVPASGYTNGVFVTNEGIYGTGTGTISFYSRSGGGVSADIFQTKNGYPLGNIVQSMELFNDKGYIVVNNAGKVEVVAGASFATQGTITGLTNPRYFLGINSTTGYVSQWGSGSTGEVKVVNLSTNTVTGTILTGNGAEAMVKSGNYVYVACSGGYTNDSVVTVIDATTNTVVTNINTGYNASSLKVDAAGKIWVLCGGRYNSSFALDQPGSIVRIDPATNTVDLTLPFSSLISSPAHLVINSAKTTLYYLFNGGICTQSVSSATLNTAPLINRSFYGLGVDPTTNYIYASDAGNFSSNGKIIRYNGASLLDSFNGGIIPGNFCFK